MMKVFFRIFNDTLHSVQVEELGFSKKTPLYIPDEYLENKNLQFSHINPNKLIVINDTIFIPINTECLYNIEKLIDSNNILTNA